MPNKHAAIKDLRKNKRRAAVNLRIKTNVKSLYRKGLALIKEGKTAEVAEVARAFQQAIDKAIKSNVVSRNAASRKKSQLMRAIKAKV
ncbi:MAG: 30S ribosomal protein S20 [Patescibacteria group bacterium]|jgi:small subunit ribosomal protein S20